MEELGELKHMIVFADENIEHKHKFAAWELYKSLNYSDDETSKWSKKKRNEYDAFCRDVIMIHQPKFAIVVHDDNFDMFSGPNGALNLIEDNLHEYITVENLNPITREEHTTTSAENPFKSIRKCKKCSIL